MFFKWTGRETGSDNLFAEAGSVRPSVAPAPYQLLVHRQGVGREQGRLWGDFGVIAVDWMLVWVLSGGGCGFRCAGCILHWMSSGSFVQSIINIFFLDSFDLVKFYIVILQRILE